MADRGMSVVRGEHNLNDLLRVELDDPGCDTTSRLLERIAEATICGLRPEQLFPQPAAHLRACAACREEVAGLVDAIMNFGNPCPP
jgi:hypothetical protein